MRPLTAFFTLLMLWSLLQTRSLQAQDATKPAPAANGAPSEKDVETALRALFERPAKGMDAAKTVTLNSIKIGTETRKWERHDGGGGIEGRDVWMVKVNFLLKRHEKAKTVVFEWVAIFRVFKNQLGEWALTQDTAPGQSTGQLPDEPADKK